MTQTEQILAEIDRRYEEKRNLPFTEYNDGYKDALDHLESFVNEQLTHSVTKSSDIVAKFKVGDRIHLIGTNVKGDVIKNIYTNECNEQMYEFEGNSDDLRVSADVDYELVSEHTSDQVFANSAKSSKDSQEFASDELKKGISEKKIGEVMLSLGVQCVEDLRIEDLMDFAYYFAQWGASHVKKSDISQPIAETCKENGVL